MQFTIVGLFFIVGLQYSIQNTYQNRQSDCDCGRDNPGDKVVAGTETTMNKYPWMAALLLSSAQFCGGSLITPQHVLSAAHCFYNQNFGASDIVVSLGDHDLTNSKETQSIHVGVESIILNPNFDPTTVQSDIAILVLKEPVTLSDTVRTICMPPANFDAVGKTAIVAGWGRTQEGGDSSPTLQEVSVTVFSNDKCGAYEAPITDDMVCAGNMESGGNSCKGDSGGPLFYNCDDKYIQIGVVSFGGRCGEPEQPVVFTRVASYLDFIKQSIQPQTLCPTSCSS